MDAVTRHAEELGIGRGMFYRLVRVVKVWDDSKEPARPRARRKPADAASATLASEAVARSGLGASLEEAIAAAVLLARSRGVAPPSERAIRGAYGLVRAGHAIRDRLKLGGSFAIDATALEVSITTGEAGSIAVLTAVVDLRTGTLVTWRISAGEADPSTLSLLVEGALPSLAGVRSITVSSALPNAIRPILVDAGIATEEQGGPGGAILKAALGAKIGRIRLLPRYFSRGSEIETPMVKFDDLHAVVTELLAVAGLTIDSSAT